MRASGACTLLLTCLIWRFLFCIVARHTLADPPPKKANVDVCLFAFLVVLSLMLFFVENHFLIKIDYEVKNKITKFYKISIVRSRTIVFRSLECPEMIPGSKLKIEQKLKFL